MNKKGLFILFEGPDKSGKTTQSMLLYKYLKKKRRKVILTREPGGTKISEKIRNILLNPSNNISPLCELFLYEAARAQHVYEKIKPAIKKGYIVICDRFTIATLAYQGYGRGVKLNLVEMLNNIATDGLVPDLIFGFQISDKEYLKRSVSKKDRIEKQSKEFRLRMNAGYRKIFGKLKKVVVIDGTRGIDEIHKIIVNEVEKYV